MNERSTNNQRLLISLQEMVLIKSSNEVRKTSLYGNLYDCIEGYKKLSRGDLDNNIVFDAKARAVLLNPDSKKAMMRNVMQEWYSKKNFDVSEPLINCELCGRKNKYIFYIHNKCTDVNLHIGSDCVKNFSDITGIKQQRSNLAQLKKETLCQQRRIEFESREDTELDFLRNAEKDFQEFPVILPYKLYNQIKEVLYQLNLVKTSYIKSGGNLDEIFEKYCSLKQKYTTLHTQAILHYQEVKDNPLVCNRETSEWLKSNNPSIWEAVAKNTGILTVNTLAKIYDEEFIRQHITIIANHLKDADININRVDKSYIHFSIKSNRYVYKITFKIPIKKFMECIGCYALTDSSFVFGRESLKDISIDSTSKNCNAVYNSISHILDKNGYDFIIESKTQQAYWKKKGHFEKKNKWSNHVVQNKPMYKRSSISIFLKAFTPFLLEDESYLEKNIKLLITNMECGQAWITQEDKNSSEEAARLARGMQKQKEYIPY